MSHRLDRAQLLLQQSRPADAERETLLALAEDPESARGHAYLALSRVDQQKNTEALAAAERAVALSPDDPFSHHIHAIVLHRLDREKAALVAINEAIRLDPENETHFAVLASVHLNLRDWAAALDAAEQGLAINPEDVQCANLRSMALVRLGRKEEAMQTVDFALERAPENAWSHANQGWNCLHRNDPKRAQDHFREALRLEPDLEYARQGMLEALKARNPIYRGMLAYFLWMGRQSGKLQWAFVIGSMFGLRAVRTLAEQRPELGMVLWPVVILFYAFIYLSWVAGPMFNLLLRFERFGRLVLSREERHATNWFGVCVILMLAGLGWWASGNLLGMFVAIVGAMLSVCVAITFNRVGKKRVGFAVATAVMAAIGLGGIAMLLSGNENGLGWLSAFFMGFLGMQLAANVVASR
jgi:tetratricopeptide (TPR) repeat protein